MLVLLPEDLESSKRARRTILILKRIQQNPRLAKPDRERLRKALEALLAPQVVPEALAAALLQNVSDALRGIGKRASVR